MKKILILLLIVLFLVGCGQEQVSEEPVVDNEQGNVNVEIEEPETVVEEPEVIVEETPEVVSTAADGAEIIIREKDFDPETVTIKAGSTVTWRNMEDKKNMVINNKIGLKSQALYQGDTYSFTFEEAGEYPIVDLLGKRGTVIVE